MPNWCNNWLVVTGENTRDIVDKIKPEGMLFETLVGGKYQGADDGWYIHNIEKYGTKWDVPMNEIDPSIVNDTELSFAFATAWSPPVGFCEMLSKKYGVKVRIEYDESGCDFAGYAEYNNGELTDMRDYDYKAGLYIMGRHDEFWSSVEWEVEESCVNLKEYQFLSDKDMNYLKRLIKQHEKGSNIQDEAKPDA